ncbi:probable chitinase 2 [Neodiprion lecontei]|uniref:Probable chitinase 2 n=1 Tax=Neodiprion lecontei TaxID=441921 RepID=A0A6J0BKY6_NEOLC|nr:probable chitinase 2 [Neodiprion lecontei]
MGNHLGFVTSGAFLIIFAAALIALQIVNGLQATTRPQHDKVVVCYVSSWAIYRPGNGRFGFDELQAEHCTHLVYAFAGLNASTSSIRSIDPWADLEEGGAKGGYKRMTELRNKHPGLKVTIAIGGWNEGSANYSELAASPQRRQTFVNSAVDFVRKYNFDGLDLDWEFPTQRGGAPHDKENFVLLAKDLSTAFRSRGLLLTAALGAGIATINAAYDVARLSEYLDYIHVMAYDYHGAWNMKVLSNAPLGRAADQLSVEDSIQHLLKLGAPRRKLVLGLPTYGRTFVLTSLLSGANDSPIGAEAMSTGFQGPYTRENGFMGYNEICSELVKEKNGWRTGWDKASGTAWAVKGDKAITFDNPNSMMMKADYAAEMKLAGVMVWSIDTDDFLGTCANINAEKLDPLLGLDYPLMRSINFALSRAPSSHDSNDNLVPDDVEPPIPDSGLQASLSSVILIISLVSSLC